MGDNLRKGYLEKILSTTNGEFTIDVPRDRNGTFEPVIIPKHKTMAQQLEHHHSFVRKRYEQFGHN